MTLIGTEGGFLDGTVVPKGVVYKNDWPPPLVLARRALDIIVDFSKVKRRPVPYPVQRCAGAVPGRDAAGGLPSRKQQARNATGARFRAEHADADAVPGSPSERSPATRSQIRRRIRHGACRRLRQRPRLWRRKMSRFTRRSTRTAAWRRTSGRSRAGRRQGNADRGRQGRNGGDVANLQHDRRHAPDALPLLQREGALAAAVSLAGGIPNITGNACRLTRQSRGGRRRCGSIRASAPPYWLTCRPQQGWRRGSDSAESAARDLRSGRRRRGVRVALPHPRARGA